MNATGGGAAGFASVLDAADAKKNRDAENADVEIQRSEDEDDAPTAELASISKTAASFASAAPIKPIPAPLESAEPAKTTKRKADPSPSGTKKVKPSPPSELDADKTTKHLNGCKSKKSVLAQFSDRQNDSINEVLPRQFRVSGSGSIEGLIKFLVRNEGWRRRSDGTYVQSKKPKAITSFFGKK
jgi:hypothetical protein